MKAGLLTRARWLHGAPPTQALYEAAAVKPSVLQNRFYPDSGCDSHPRAMQDRVFSDSSD